MSGSDDSKENPDYGDAGWVVGAEMAVNWIDPESQLIAEQRDAAIAQARDCALAGVSAEAKEILLWREEGVSYAEIEARKGWSTGTATNRLCAARKLLGRPTPATSTGAPCFHEDELHPALVKADIRPWCPSSHCLNDLFNPKENLCISKKAKPMQFERMKSAGDKVGKSCAFPCLISRPIAGAITATSPARTRHEFQGTIYLSAYRLEDEPEEKKHEALCWSGDPANSVPVPGELALRVVEVAAAYGCREGVRVEPFRDVSGRGPEAPEAPVFMNFLMVA